MALNINYVISRLINYQHFNSISFEVGPMQFPEFLNSYLTIFVGFTHLRSLMKEREAAGNVLMDTTGGEGSLSQIPSLVLGAIFLTTKVSCAYDV